MPCGLARKAIWREVISTHSAMQAAAASPPISVTPSHSGSLPLACLPTMTTIALAMTNQAGMSHANPRGYRLAGPRTRHVTVSSKPASPRGP